jgi:hypothetical protein
MMAQFANNFMFAQQQTQHNHSTFQSSNVSPMGGVFGILPVQNQQATGHYDPYFQPQMDFNPGMPFDPFGGGYGMNFGGMPGYDMGYGNFPPNQQMVAPGYQPQAGYDPYQAQPAYNPYQAQPGYDPYQVQPGFGGMPNAQPGGMNFGIPQNQGWSDPSMNVYPQGMNNNGWEGNQPAANWGAQGNVGMSMMSNNYNPPANNPMGDWNVSMETQGVNIKSDQMVGKLEVKPKKKK